MTHGGTSYPEQYAQPFRYAGYYYDEETGLYYCKSRYYSPTLGRFLTRDAYGYIDYGNPQTLNLYSYCVNNPVNNIDPSGHFAFVIPIAYGAAEFAYACLLTAGIILKASEWGNPNTLQDHYDRHGDDFGVTSPDEYAEKANDFFKEKDNYDVKVDEDGTIRVYDPDTNTFGSYNPDGTTKTFFKPDDGQDYWDDQPGVEVEPGEY